MKVLHLVTICSTRVLLLVFFVVSSQDSSAELCFQNASSPSQFKHTLLMSSSDLLTLPKANTHFDTHMISINKFHKIDLQRVL